MNEREKHISLLVDIKSDLRYGKVDAAYQQRMAERLQPVIDFLRDEQAAIERFVFSKWEVDFPEN